MKLKEFLDRHLQEPLGKGPKSDVVISSRVRLARNIANRIFTWRANNSVLEDIWETTRDLVRAQNIIRGAEFYLLSEISPVDRQLLIERRLISSEHAAGDWPRGVIIIPDGRTSVMVNEEDHLRIASTMPGLNLAECAAAVSTIDNSLSKHIDFAFSEQLGFLTACPTNTGTAMRASCLVHLPGLVIREKIEPMLSELSKLGIVVRGFYSDGSKVIGDIFQITNATTLGRSETEILRNIEHVVNGIITFEKNARNELLTPRYKAETEDRIFRSNALLSSARKIDFKEAMELISMVKLGLGLGLELPWKEEVINELIILIQPAHIQEIVGKLLTPDERDYIRAKIIRQKLTTDTN